MRITDRGGGAFVPEILFASCHAQREGAAVWGSFLRHRGCVEEGVPGVAGRDKGSGDNTDPDEGKSKNAA